jgi:hypothetical protein
LQLLLRLLIPWRGEARNILEQNQFGLEKSGEFHAFQDQSSACVTLSIFVLTAKRLARRTNNQQIQAFYAPQLPLVLRFQQTNVGLDESSSWVVKLESSTRYWIIIDRG